MKDAVLFLAALGLCTLFEFFMWSTCAAVDVWRDRRVKGGA